MADFSSPSADASDPTSSSTVPTPDESLLVLSDVHLGSDLNDHLPASATIRRSRAIDQDLVQLLSHYRRTRAPSGAGLWRLVIAGDFVDFIGITIRGDGETLETALSEEEGANGVGNAADHARLKLRRVVARHPEVFAALGGFVADGHALAIIHGNHDLEFHWDAVKEDFRQAILRAAKADGRVSDDVAEQAFLQRVVFHPWFLYVGGVAYIEHGHQYDPYCATDHVMAPLSPGDPRRTARGFCDVLLRHIVRHTRGLREHGHEHRGMLHYVAFAASLGARGLVRLGLRFARAVVELFRLRHEALSANAGTLRQEHERRMALLAEATRIGMDRLRALAALQTPPVTRSIRGILASVLLDRLALALATAIALVVAAVVGARNGHAFAAMACVAMAWTLASRHLARQRRLDPGDDMVGRAGQLARLFPAAFVVMGHTHAPTRVPVNDGGSTYINVGSWAEEEPEAAAASAEEAPPSYRAPRTHLVITMEGGAPKAEFLTWDSSAGPKAFRQRETA